MHQLAAVRAHPVVLLVRSVRCFEDRISGFGIRLTLEVLPTAPPSKHGCSIIVMTFGKHLSRRTFSTEIEQLRYYRYPGYGLARILCELLAGSRGFAVEVQASLGLKRFCYDIP